MLARLPEAGDGAILLGDFNFDGGKLIRRRAPAKQALATGPSDASSDQPRQSHA
jgi:hypothetical protein